MRGIREVQVLSLRILGEAHSLHGDAGVPQGPEEVFEEGSEGGELVRPQDHGSGLEGRSQLLQESRFPVPRRARRTRGPQKGQSRRSFTRASTARITSSGARAMGSACRAR